MHPQAKKIFFLLQMLLLLSCEQPQQLNVTLREGAYYSIINDENSFTVAKIIAMDSTGFFVKFYDNTFPDRPKSVDPSKLVPLTKNTKYKARYMGMERPDFFAYVPIYIQDGKISGGELAAYELWKLRNGGHWKSR